MSSDDNQVCEKLGSDCRNLAQPLLVSPPSQTCSISESSQKFQPQRPVSTLSIKITKNIYADK